MSEDNTWDEHAQTWDTGGPVAYADAAAASLVRHTQPLGFALSGARVLDFGCGTGLLSERMVARGARVVALDPSPGMMAGLRAKIEAGLEGVEAIEGHLEEGHPALEQPFDLIVASSVCAFLPNYPRTVRELAELLQPGGLFVQWDWAWNAEDDEPFGLTREAIREALSGAGLTVCRVDLGFEADFEGQTMAPLMGIGRR